MCKPQIFGLQIGSGSAKFASDRWAGSPRISLDTSLQIDVVQYFMDVCMVTLNYVLLWLKNCTSELLEKIWAICVSVFRTHISMISIVLR